MPLTLDGGSFDAMQRRLRDLSERGRSIDRDAVTAHARDVLEASLPLVPVKTGVLKDSALIEIDESADAISATVSYGVPYAAAVHEALTARHPHGQAKFLETPLVGSGDGLVKRASEALRRALEG